jgi:septum formation protein
MTGKIIGPVPLTPPARLVLASGSAARLRVLRDAGFDPEIVVSGVNEDVAEDLDTARAVVVLAERKATAVASRTPNGLVLGCDSMLDLDRTTLGKPASGADVIDMWRLLSGHHGQLFTGHCLIDTESGQQISRVASTLIRFGIPTEAEITAYSARAEPLSMAGAFSIEGLGAPFVDSIEGDPSNVLGLSLPLLLRMLASLGVSIPELWRKPPDRSA